MGKDGQQLARAGNDIKWAKLEDLYFNDFFEVFLTFWNLKLVSEGQIGCGHVLPTMGKVGQLWARLGNNGQGQAMTFNVQIFQFFQLMALPTNAHPCP